MPRRLAVRLASILSPMMRIWSPDGPMKVMLCAARISANLAFSDRKAVTPDARPSAPVILAGRDDLMNVEIAVARWAAGRCTRSSSASRTCMASASAVECTTTRLDAEFLAGAQHPKRDFAAIGDEDFLKTSGPL